MLWTPLGSDVICGRSLNEMRASLEKTEFKPMNGDEGKIGGPLALSLSLRSVKTVHDGCARFGFSSSPDGKKSQFLIKPILFSPFSSSVKSRGRANPTTVVSGGICASFRMMNDR